MLIVIDVCKTMKIGNIGGWASFHGSKLYFIRYMYVNHFKSHVESTVVHDVIVVDI
jgi:hypothetical protein